MINIRRTLMSCKIDSRLRLDISFLHFILLFETLIVAHLFIAILQQRNLMSQLFDLLLIVSDFSCTVCLHLIQHIVDLIQFLLAFSIGHCNNLLDAFHFFYKLLLVVESLLQDLALLLLSFQLILEEKLVLGRDGRG